MKHDRPGEGDLLDRIARYLDERPAGVQAAEIARLFLRVQDPRARLVGPIVHALLAGDARFRLLGTQLWGRAPAESGSSPGREPDAFLYGALRRSPSDPHALLLAFLRVQEGWEKGGIVFAARRGEGEGPPPDLFPLAEDARLVVFRAAATFLRFAEGAGMEHGSVLRLRTLAAGLVPAPALRSPERLARHLGLCFDEGEDPLLEARLLREIHVCIEEAAGASYEPAGPPGGEEIPFLREGGAEFLAGLPERPGVYRMRDAAGRLLYVGKSRSLRARVGSYFDGFGALPPDKKELVRKVARIDVDPLGSEAEALLEEWRSIRGRRPPYNEQVEVWADPAPAVRGRDAIVFLSSIDPMSVTLFLLRADGAHVRMRARRNPRRAGRTGEAILRFFRGEGGVHEPGAYAILTRWIDRERARLTLLDVARYRDEEDLLRVVVDCLRDRDIASGDPIEPL